MPVLAGRGSNLAKHTYKSKINLAKGGPDFASFAKFGDKIANLATLKPGLKLVLDGRLRLEIVNKIDATADNRF